MSLSGLFLPESVAVVGASPNMGVGKIPYYQMIRNAGYKGRLYPINPRQTDIDGCRVYPDVESLPEPVDLLIVAAPAKAALGIVKAASKKGVKFVHFFTSGFSEMGEKGLEKELLEAKGATRILGPNCLGVHCTESRVCFDPYFKQTGTGQAAFVGQSGGITANFLWMCESREIPVNKVVSFGNQIDITAADMIEYMTGDDTVKVISAYIEDVRDGRRFMDVLRRAAAVKPVIMLKGGTTELGARAAASHTGAMAGSTEIWSAAMRQCGCVEAETFEQLIDMVMLATSYRPPTGRRLGFLCAGGGTAVLFTDLAASNGLSLPPLAKVTQDAIASRVKSVNTFTINPVDLGAYGFDFNIMSQTMAEMDSDPNIDVIIPYFSIDFITTFQSDQIESGPHAIIETARRLKKPVIPILSMFTEDNIQKHETRIRIARIFREAELAVFINLQDCIHALARSSGRRPE
ncbi:MAG: CoA-binding protein [Myxococcota bacterium]|jgi:acetyl-CoA synthetase (ADP-forming)/acetyltransferase